MKNARMTICLVVAVLVMVAGQVFGLIEFKDGGIHNIDYQVNGDLVVDFDFEALNKQTTVNLLEGGNISYPYSLYGHNKSKINIVGGLVDGLCAYDNSQITMSAGRVQMLLDASGYSQVTISGGSVGLGLVTRNDSQVTMSGGYVDGFLRAYDYSQVTISGGRVGEMLIPAGYGATLIINGFGFAIDGNPVGDVTITSIYGGLFLDEPFRRLTGTLANGDTINNQFQIGHESTIVLVPEPATLLLFGFGAVMLRRKR